MNAMFKISCLLHLLAVVGALIDGASSSLVRLRGGETPFEGRVEIFKNGEWGAVCNNGWDIKDAEVVCREVGFPGAMLPSPANHPFQKREDGRVLITKVECTGTEESISECRYSTDTSGCNKNKDAGVFCNFPGYVGCFDDVGYDDGPHSTHPSMTIQRCLSYCRAYDTVYASLMEENCRCGNDLPDTGRRSDNWSCSHRCPGDITQACGKTQNAVYKTTLGACGGKITNQEDWILSPEFPAKYSWSWFGSNRCKWSIQVTNHGTKINVILKMLYLNGNYFSSDSVSLYPIEDRQNNRVTLTRSSGIRGVGDYEIGVTIDNILDLDFTSVVFSSDIEFAIFYKAFVPGECEDSDFCQNNGTCFNDGDSDTCVCKEGWTGMHCEDKVDVCHRSPCLNNGTCDYISTGGNYSVYCLCQPGYFGKFCEERITCENMTICQNNGTCTMKSNTIYCDCQPGYSGLLCESNITTVLPQPTKQTTAVITRFTRPDQPRVSPSPSSLSNQPSTNTRPGVSPTTLDARYTQTRVFDKSTGDKSQASIIGGSVAVAMVLLIVAVIAVFVICRKRSKAPGRKNTNNEMTKFNNLSYEDVLEIKQYQVTNDKQGTDVFPGNSGNGVYYSSIDDKKIARDGGIVDKASYKTSNDTDERAAFKIGFVENIAYEESMAKDNMKEGFVDNVAYEASIDPDKGNTGGGFVDNVMYEATIDPDQRAGDGAKDGSSFVDNVAYETSTEQEERDNVEDGFVDNVAYETSMDRKERNRPSEGFVDRVAYPPATGRDDGHSSTHGFVDNIVYESSIGNDEESTTTEGVCNNVGEAAGMNKDHGNGSENGIVENVVYESAENDENNYEEI